MNLPTLVSTISGTTFPFSRMEEFADNGESLEVMVPNLETAQPRAGMRLCERFRDFMPFARMDGDVSLGEGGTPLLRAGTRLQKLTGLRNLLLKNETQNPTWSFKDRGSLACIFMARQMNEDVTATISTGNMGQSVAAYAARAGMKSIVFIPAFAPGEKTVPMAFHGATVIRVACGDYSAMKQKVLSMAGTMRLRVVSGNGPIRAEGYKLTAFEMYEQMEGRVPDFIAVPTSACGHIRGIFKGYRELMTAGLIRTLPRMIVVQAANNSPIASAIKGARDHIIPFTDVHTIAEAITSGNPPGGDELLHKAKRFGWLAEDVTEEEILESQRAFAGEGYFLEPAAATSLWAVKKLRTTGAIARDASVVLLLTGAGMKDMDVMRRQPLSTRETTLDRLENDLREVLCR